MRKNYLAIKAASRILDRTGLNHAQTIKQNLYNVPEDFQEFARLCRIRSGKKIIPFDLYDYQIELAKLLDTYRGIIVFKTRQLGATETIACKFLHKAILNPAYVAGILSMGQEESSNVARRIRKMPAAIPNFQFATNNLKDLELKGGGRVVFRPSTDNAIRSLESVSDLLFDESAFVDNAEEIYSSAVPAQEMVGAEARTAIVSTMSQSGKLSWFWKMFASNNGSIDAERVCARVRENLDEPYQFWVDDTGWAKAVLHWKSHPIYSQVPDYLERTREEKKLTEDKVQREYNLGIPASGASLFQADLVNLFAIGNWCPAKRDRVYLAGIDPNFGGTDYFCMLIWDVTEAPYQLVCQYRDNGHSNSYHQEKVLQLLDSYQPAITAIESNSGGAVILEDLIVARSSLRFEKVNTSAVSKRVNTDRLAIALEGGTVCYPPDWQGIEEMKNFSTKDRKAVAGHDDCVMAWAAAWVWIGELIATEENLLARAFG
ncbi:MAG TPA: hypothetical protein VK211_23435 [Kamptonema sp.]|nr:hypothetical protein [Kamptonema sp.]